MKALKLKGSSTDNPVWGETYLDCNVYHEIMESDEPSIFPDAMKMKNIKESSYHQALKTVDKWELVPIEIIVK